MDIIKRNYPVEVKWVIVKLDGKIVGNYGLTYFNQNRKTT
jgi:hypothetical protein